MARSIGSRRRQSRCMICYDSLDGNNQQNDDEIIIVKTMCRHVFHNDCIQQWLLRSSTCPECRSPVSRIEVEKLFINFCVDKSDNNNAEQWDALNDLLCAKDLDGMEKDKKIAGLQVDRSISERKIEEKDRKIAVLRAQLSVYERKIREREKIIEEKDKKIEEKDKKIQELQTCLAHDSLEKDKVIVGLQIDNAVCEKKIEERNMKIQQLETVYPFLQQEIRLKNETNQKLQTDCAQFKQESSEKSKKIMEILQEKNTLVKKLELMSNNAKAIVDRCPVVMTDDAKKISTNTKAPVSQENQTSFINLLTKLKQPDSSIEKTNVKYAFKLVKQTETLQSDSEKIMGQPRERRKDSNSSSPSLSGGPSNAPVMSSLPVSHCYRPSCNKNDVTPIIQNFSSGNKRQKVGSSNFAERYRLIPIELENPVLPAKRKL